MCSLFCSGLPPTNLSSKTPQITILKYLKYVDEGVAHLLKIESLIRENNTAAEMPIREPDLKIVITGTEYGYRRDDGVFVIPIATMRD